MIELWDIYNTDMKRDSAPDFTEWLFLLSQFGGQEDGRMDF